MRYHNFFARIFLAFFGFAAATWGLYTIPILWRQAPIEYVAQHIIRGEPYKIDDLKRQIPAIEAVENSTICRPIALWSATIIRLRMVEEANHDEQKKPIVSSIMTILDKSIRHSISCSAAEPFLWLLLYWSQSTQNGFNFERSKYLRMSYRLGPNEGWIALRRNPVAFANYENLPRDLQTQAITEFLTLINSEFYEEAAHIFSGPAWRLRDTIIPYLSSLQNRKLENFARILYRYGLDVKIPGQATPKPLH